MAKVKEYLMSLQAKEFENVKPINELAAMKSKVFQCLNKDLMLIMLGEADFVITQEGYEALKLQMSSRQLQTHSANLIDAILAATHYDTLYTTEDVLNGTLNLKSRVYNS